LPTDVRELVSRCLAGEQAATLELVRRFQGRVFGLCYRMVGQLQDAEDMAQETFVRALRHLDRWDASREFEPWLLTIAGNRCRSLLATRMRRPSPAPLEHAVADPRDDLGAARQLSEEVELALAGLREEYRQAFLLFHEQELSYAEIGEILDCPLGTVKTWVRRARCELIDQLRRRGVVRERPHHEVRRI
jgi:RNA polymerase sigma-70 factor (ECF subfamily)